jgi:hypothetical protein
MQASTLSGIALAMAVATGCGGSDDADGTEPGPDPNVISLKTGTYHLESGEEKYMCYTMNLPADRELSIYEIEPVYGKGVHHTFFAWTLIPEEQAEFECPVLFETTWIPLYLGGVGTDPLRLPEGTGFKMEAGRQMLVQLHLQNTTFEPMEDTTTINIHAIDDDPSIIPAGIFGMDNRVIDVAPNAKGVTTSMECEATRDMEVFASLPHMHKAGRHIELSRQGDAEPLYSETWSFDDQPMIPLKTTIKKGDMLDLSCTFDNNNDTAIGYGESSDNEMCASVLYYTPFDALDGCIVIH